MATLTVTEAKAHLLELIRKADRTMQHFIISKNGKPKAILMSIDEYESWLETIEVLSDKDALEDIREARKELSGGGGHTFKEVFKRSPRKK